MKRLKLKKINFVNGYFLLTATCAQVSAATLTIIDPATGRTVFVDTPTGIDGCDTGLVLFETGYVCKSLIPPPLPKPPTPQPIYPPADAVCRGDYPVETDGVGELRCASGYIRRNRSHQDNAWCEMTAAQKELCTVIYPPPEPDPGPGHDYGHQIGYRGPDGQLHETKDPNSPPCGNCKDGGPTDTKDDPNTTDTSPPGDGSTDGNTDGDGTGGE